MVWKMPTPPLNPDREPSEDARTEVLTWKWDGSTPVGSQVHFDQTGRLTAVQLADADRIVAALGPERLGDEPWVPEEVRIDADEIEATATFGAVHMRVRHNFDHTWQLRISLTNTGVEEVRPGRLVLATAAAEDAFLWVHAAGALAFLVFMRRHGDMCLALRLTRGDLICEDGVLATPALVLGSGDRYQLTLSGEWYADAGAVRQRYPAWFPAQVDLDAADDDVPVGHEDAAIVRRDADAGSPARLVRVEVSDAVGVTRVDLAYAAEEPTYAAVAEAVARVGHITGAAEGLCVHQAMINHDLAQDSALDLIRDYLSTPPDPPAPLRVALRTQLHIWTGEPRLLEEAETELRALPAGPGVPLAWLTLWAAQRLGEREPTGIPEVAARLRGLVGQPGIDPVTRAELSLMVALRDPAEQRRTAAAVQEVELLCAGGPGQLWPPRPDVDRARAVVVRSLLPPAAGVEQPDLHEAVRRLLARAGTGPEGREVLGWLTLRGRP